MMPAALAGAALLLAADIAVRIVPSANELKVGVVTALIGEIRRRDTPTPVPLSRCVVR